VPVISGPVDVEAAVEMVRSKFDFGPASEPCLPGMQQYPPIETGQIIVDASDHTGFSVGMCCRIPLDNEQDAALANSLVEFFDQSWLGIGMSSVPDEMVFMAHARGAYFHPPTDPEQHYGMAFPEVDSEQDAQRALGALWKELHQTLDELREPEFFEEARNRVLNSLNLQGEIRETGSGCGQAMINGNQYLDPQTMAGLLETISPSDLQDFANRFLRPERAVIGVSHGSDSGRQNAINMAGRVAPNPGLNAQDSMNLLGEDLIGPVLEVYRHAELFQFQQSRLPNGTPLHCLVIPDADRWYLAGYKTFPELKPFRHNKLPGLGYLYNSVARYDDAQGLDRFNPKPAKKLPFNLYFNLKPWRLSFGADGSPERSKKLVGTISQRFKSREFNNTRWSSTLYWGEKNLNRILNNGQNAATAWRWQQVLGEKHSYLSMWAPNPETAKEVNYKDLKKLHGKVTGKVGNTVLVAAGPLNLKALETELKGTLGRYGQREERFGFSQGKGDLHGIEGKVFHIPDKGDVRLVLSFKPQLK